ncbi:MAG: PadR family transcriptional regulator [Microbacteriaceae bacterium]
MAQPTPVTGLGIASLALLVERPMHPYEMYQLLIQRAEDRVVKVRPGSLYHTVDRLALRGFVRATGTEREGNRPERTTYEVTEAGRCILTERISDMLANPVNEYPQFPLAIGEAHNLPAKAVIDLLSRRMDDLRSQRDLLEASVATVTEKAIERKYWLDLSYQQAMLQAEMSWIENLVDEMGHNRINW